MAERMPLINHNQVNHDQKF